jgi:glycosyltransferase involved in cell wall biosynthesis
MRVGMFTYFGFPPDIRIENEANALVEAGHDVTVLASERNNRRHVHALGAVRVKYVCLPYGPFPLASPPYLRRVLRSCHLDVLHIQDAPGSSAAAIAARSLSLKVVLDLHEVWFLLRLYDPRLGGWRSPLKFAHLAWTSYEDLVSTRIADVVITIVEEMSDYYQRRFGVSPGKLHAIKNLVNLREFTGLAPAGLPSQGFYVTYVGGMESYIRNLGPIVRAASHLVDMPDIKFLMVGDGAYRPRLEQMAKTLGVQDKLIFAGRVPRERALSYILASDICILPHLKTPLTDMGLPHKFTQYLAAEKPVISTPLRPITRMFSQAIYQWYPSTPERLSEIVRDLYSNPALRQRLAAAGHDLVHKEYNWEIEKKKLISIYDSLS